MQEDLEKELELFGLTLNQAILYLTVVRAGPISVGKIAEYTNLHRQDIYKILPKLEKSGLIVKTLDKPFKVRAINTRKALENLISNEKIHFAERLSYMESNLNRTSDMISKLENTATVTEQDRHFSLLKEEKEIVNMDDFLFENASIECDVDLSLELLTLRSAKFRERFHNAAKSEAKIRLIIENPTLNRQVYLAVKRVKPESNDFIAKFIETKSPIPYQIIDNKEIWIFRNKKLSSGVPCVLWTNSINIGQVYRERFQASWNNPKAVTIFPEEHK